jgi:DNA-binding NarL/FixJ family response regulator
MYNSGLTVVVSSEPHVGDRVVSSLRRCRRAVLSVDDAVKAAPLVGSSNVAAIVLCLERATDWVECDAIVRAARQHHARVVALTRWTSPDGRFRRRAFDLGCAAFVEGPCDGEVLASILDRIAAGEDHIEVAAS